MEPETGETGLFPRNPEEAGPPGLPPKVGRPTPELRPEMGLPELGLPEFGLPAELGLPTELGLPAELGLTAELGLAAELGLPDPPGGAPKEEETAGLEADPPKGRFDPEGLGESTDPP